MNESYFKTIAKQAMATAVYPDPRFPPSPYYRFMKVLAQNMHPKLSVELGVCGGGGSLHLAMGWEAGQVVGVDLGYTEYRENIEFIKERYKNFHFWIGDSVASANQIHNDFGKVDILFIDTTHTYEQTMKEFNAYRPYLSDKAAVLLDDLFRPGMIDAWNELKGDKLRLDYLHPGAENGGGFGVLYNVK